MLQLLSSKYADAIGAALQREYPNSMGHMIRSATDTPTPRQAHPAFYGCFDWHSAVEMHWALAVLARRCPDQVDMAVLSELFNAHLTPENLAVEAAYLRDNPGWERPYGWGWALQLAAELIDWADCDVCVVKWAEAITPLARQLSSELAAYLEMFTLPIRGGTHANSAFSMARAYQWAEKEDPALLSSIRNAARRYYQSDRNYPVHYEPSANDFLSPALTEIDIMHKVLPEEDFSSWFSAFLPDAGPLLEPVPVACHDDGQGTHLNGLNLYRAGMLRSLAPWWGNRATEAAEAHLDVALPQVLGAGWMAEHWLAAFAVLALK